MAELKPCPFCGGKGVLVHAGKGVATFSFIQCTSCFCRTKDCYISTNHACDKEAAEEWNRRVGDT